MNVLDVLLFLPSIFLGIIMGGNDAGNTLGVTIGNGVFKAKKAITIAAIVVIIGAFLGGKPGLKLASGIVKVDLAGMVIINLSAAVVTLFFLRKGLPISMTQAIIGANVGVGILLKNINTQILLYIVLGWFSTPVVAFILGFTLQKVLSTMFRGIRNLQVRFYILRVFLWFFTIYGAYSMGANDVGKITGILYQRGYNSYLLLFIGGLSLSAGIVLLSKKTIYTLGRELIALDDFTAMMTVATQALTIWLYSLVGLPVSPAHAIIGSLVGVGYSKGTRLQNPKVFQKILFSWIEAPLYGGIFSALMYSIYKLLW
ncbi:inorganic phosphate transporter, PiT family [Fervidobacterium changbaicum]|uniref:Inorganic phosphate transporter n=1 Tax=Fervidobacterium changbaicum TaxID=310769 RepID=A0AAE6CDW3_9BACT|nr:inorganic phosphate transporter [Fervidobacterium changbaicum]QAV33159.1 inorganic phosphate transporter [Fervidobacterium changbaicum]SDH12101.1 inorganic phosphate transporter, PiT family [Fervidobacterium changbaicum]